MELNEYASSEIPIGDRNVARLVRFTSAATCPASRRRRRLARMLPNQSAGAATHAAPPARSARGVPWNGAETVVRDPTRAIKSLRSGKST